MPIKKGRPKRKIIFAILILVIVVFGFWFYYYQKYQRLSPTAVNFGYNINNANFNANMKKIIIRQPAVAGAFYPDQTTELQRMINGFMSSADKLKTDGELKMVIVPHAGLVFSGPVAAYSFKQINPDEFDRAVILGPSHHFPVAGVYASGADAWQTPLGQIKVARNDYFPTNDDIHQPEHAVEIELPFLQIVFLERKFAVMPLVVGSLSDQKRQNFLKELDQLANNKSLIVVSVDLSHYHSYDEAIKLDKISTDAILSLDASQVDNLEIDSPEAIKTIIELAKKNNWRPILLKYANSGDISGDKTKVVGYAAIGFYGAIDKINAAANSDENYNESEKKELLGLARTTLENYLKDNKTIKPDTDNAKFLAKRGVFVTLRENGNLRGCIGYIEPVATIIEAVRDNAISAAVNDPRFPPVTASELEKIKIEISILTEPILTTLEEIITGRDGVVLRQGRQGATYLPQVWEDLSNREEFFSSLCLKAGLDADCWQDPTTEFSKYQAIVFGE